MPVELMTRAEMIEELNEFYEEFEEDDGVDLEGVRITVTDDNIVTITVPVTDLVANSEWPDDMGHVELVE